MINVVFNNFFNRKGFILDDAYDKFKLRSFFEFYLKNKIEYINSRDVALENLNCFSNLKYLTIPDEAIHFSELSALAELKGIELLYSQLQSIPLSMQKSLESLILHIGNDSVVFNDNFVNLHQLKIDGFPGFSNTDLKFLSNLRLKELSISSRNLKTLQGIECQQDLENLQIHSCSGLCDVTDLCSLKKLKTLYLSECNKLPKIFIDFLPDSLENLSIYGSEYMGPKSSFQRVDFLQKMTNLQVLKTNWKISPEQLEIIKNVVPRVEIYT